MFNFENLKTYIEGKDFDIQIGETINGSECLVANWNNYQRIENMIETMQRYGYNIELLWDDTTTSCTHCYKYFDTIPSYYGDQSNIGIWVSDHELLCPHCAIEFIDDVIDYHKNSTDFVAPSWMIATLKEYGFECLEDCKIYASGLHPGQNDSPVDIAKNLEKEGITVDYDFMFALTDIGQFDVHFTVLIRERE